MVYNGYYKVMSNIPKMGQLPTPVQGKMVFPHIALMKKRLFRGYFWTKQVDGLNPSQTYH
jgi:hypothetical protein